MCPFYLRQCVMEVFCSTSTDRSRKSSSLLLIWKKRQHTFFHKHTHSCTPTHTIALQNPHNPVPTGALSLHRVTLAADLFNLKTNLFKQDGGDAFANALKSHRVMFHAQAERVTVSQVRQRVSLVRVPWKISWTQVGAGVALLLLFWESSVPLARRPFVFSCLRSSCSRSAMVFRR